MMERLEKVIALREQCTVERDDRRGDFAAYYGKLRKQRESDQPSVAPSAPAVPRRREQAITPLERAVHDILERGNRDRGRAPEIAATVERFVAATHAATDKLECGSRTDVIDVPDLELLDDLETQGAPTVDDAALDAAIEAAATAESLADASAADVAIAGSIAELLGTGTLVGMGVGTATTANAPAGPAGPDAALDAWTEPSSSGAAIADLLAASIACPTTGPVHAVELYDDDDDVLGDGSLGDSRLGGLDAAGLGSRGGIDGTATTTKGVSTAAGIHAALVAGETTELPTQLQATSHMHLVVGEDTQRIVVTVAVRGEHVATTVRGANEQLSASLARNAAQLDDALRAKGLALEELETHSDDDARHRSPERDTQPEDQDHA